MTLTIDEMAAFCREKNLFFPSPEIYGAVAGFFTYGPLGKALKNNVENAIRKIFIKYDCWEVECPTVLPKIVWEASGHLGSFSDAIIDCSKCAGSFRVDKLIEEKCGPQNIKESDFIDFMKKNDINCPKCKSELKWEIRNHPLMMQTEVAGKESKTRNSNCNLPSISKIC